ncbi:alkylhydroperoxidase [Actibacterium mucosum KCTC 23349]|uniref:Alkylhydroperoxidase n=1 Tax=Actibacterium mucosum KCTC 23349 TaxID=1454373 RepID=A0A037ZKU0_9RHOB|nr:peroxidase-related enzyme [Actibacterium mucosum]KAJ56172.1 alkylhydroperoxidase [Actibacterium mucosum KCTC 23349]
MAWIKTVPYAESSGRLRRLYDRVKGPGDNVDNIMMAHSLRPHSMEGHMALYKNVLHHTGNVVPKWFLEVLGVWVSLLNRCDYCVEHHFAGLSRLLDDPARAQAVRAGLEAAAPNQTGLTDAQIAALDYARKLTEAPASVTEGDMATLRAAGWDDGEILEINQVTAYFAYANRTVLGLGCSTQGDVLGLSPGNSENPDDWSHH